MSDDELLSVYDSTGNQTGVKRRGQVHKNGDWHSLVFLWAGRTGEDGSRRLLLQLRSRSDDRYKGQVDALAGGHVSADETHLEAAIRELDEEAGIKIHEEDLICLGFRFLENPRGVCKRVIEHFYMCRHPIHLSDVAFTDEVDGYVEVDLDDFSDLLLGKLKSVDAMTKLRAGGQEVHRTTLNMNALAAYSDEIRDSFVRSMSAVRYYLDNGEVDLGVWDR